MFHDFVSLIVLTTLARPFVNRDVDNATQTFLAMLSHAIIKTLFLKNLQKNCFRLSV